MVLLIRIGKVEIPVQRVSGEIEILEIFLQDVQVKRTLAELVVQVAELPLLLLVQVVPDHNRDLLQTQRFSRLEDPVPDDNHPVRVHGDRPRPAIVPEGLHQVPDLLLRMCLRIEPVRDEIVSRQPLPVVHVDRLLCHVSSFPAGRCAQSEHRQWSASLKI